MLQRANIKFPALNLGTKCTNNVNKNKCILCLKNSESLKRFKARLASNQWKMTNGVIER